MTKKYGIRTVCVGGDCSTATAFSDLFAAVDAFDGCELRVAVHAAGQEVGITGDNSRGLGGERLGKSSFRLGFGTEGVVWHRRTLTWREH